MNRASTFPAAVLERSDTRPSSPLVSLPPNPTRTDLHRSLFARILYRSLWHVGRLIGFLSVRVVRVNEAALETPGGYLLACTHLSHLEPFIVGLFSRRQVQWMTRAEFFHSRIATGFMLRFGAFCVRRQGVPVSAIRTAIARLNEGQVVGICPEGGVARGPLSVCRGGPIKLGTAMLAHRAQKPVIPCVVIGAHDLLRISPWLPFRRGRLWIAFGSPIYPPDPTVPRRTARQLMTAELHTQYALLYQRLIGQFNIDEQRWT